MTDGVITSCRSGISFHQVQPFPVAEDGNQRIAAVESGCKIDALVNIESCADGIDGYPYQPLFYILTSQQPKTYDTGGSGKRVPIGNIAVGTGQKDSGNGGPNGQPCDG